MSERTKGSAKELIGTPRPAGVRVARNKWAEFEHLSDEELVAKGIPMRMVRRLRAKA